MILLDTHTLIWFSTDHPKLSPRARALLEAPQPLFVSATSGWEIVIKYRLGKLPGVQPMIDGFARKLRAVGFSFLSITIEHSVLAATFPMAHKDPFDRLIAAQAVLEKMPLLSSDASLDAFPIQRVW